MHDMINTLTLTLTITLTLTGDVAHTHLKVLYQHPLKSEYTELVENPDLLELWIQEMEAVGNTDGRLWLVGCHRM